MLYQYRKLIIGSIVGLIGIIILIIVLAPFYDTGLVLSVPQTGITVTLDGKSLSGVMTIKLKPGKYHLFAYGKGYLSQDESITVGNYGKTNKTVSLTQINVPIFDNYISDRYRFSLATKYTDQGVPYFTVAYDGTDETKKQALDWLKSQGTDISKVKIEFIVDGG